MEVTATNTSGSNLTSSTTTAKLASDFETFLKMLTTQMKNQDPLNPVDSTEYATQLAMFSSVEQQVLTNDRLELIQETLLGNSLSQVADWVGKLARVEGAFTLNAKNYEFELPKDEDRQARQLAIKDESGQIIYVKQILKSDEIAAWDGQNGTLGTSYSAVIQLLDSEGNVTSELAAAHYSKVSEVRLLNQQTLALLEGGTAVPISQITALRQSEEEPKAFGNNDT